MEKVVVSAPGKIIIAGEHAVVYGQPAIVGTINKRIKVSLRWREDGKIVIKDKHKNLSLVRFAVKQCLRGMGNKGVDIEIESEIPVGSGLGSSAALATAIVFGMMKDESEEIKNELIKLSEDKQHGKSSGVDQTVVREGGVLKFQKGKGFGKFELPNLKFILIDSGKPVESTGEMVKKVSRGSFEKEFRRMGQIADNWRVEKISENQRLLEKIGVVGLIAKKMVREIEEIGGMAKICGAGGVKRGSGVILAFCDRIEALKRLANKNNWPWFQTKLGVEGVRYETS